MNFEDEESAPRTFSSARQPAKKKKQRKKTHNHIGPNERLFRSGRAWCPVCDAEKILRVTDRERDRDRALVEEKSPRDLAKSKR